MHGQRCKYRFNEHGRWLISTFNTARIHLTTFFVVIAGSKAWLVTEGKGLLPQHVYDLSCLSDTDPNLICIVS